MRRMKIDSRFPVRSRLEYELVHFQYAFNAMRYICHCNCASYRSLIATQTRGKSVGIGE